MSSRLLDLISHVIIAVKIEDVCDEVECVLVVLDIGIESRQVEAVCEVVFVDFAEVLVAPRRYKLVKQVSGTIDQHNQYKLSIRHKRWPVMPGLHTISE